LQNRRLQRNAVILELFDIFMFASFLSILNIKVFRRFFYPYIKDEYG